MPWIAPNGGTPIFVEGDGRMSSAQLIEHSKRQPVNQKLGWNDNYAGGVADSVGVDGLVMFEETDGSGRPIRTFSLPKGETKMSTWMGKHATAPRLMICMSRDAEWNKTRRSEFLAEHPAIAALQVGETK